MSHNNEINLADQQLVRAVLTGDRDAFARMIKQSEGLVAQMTFRMINSPGDRKDIAQDVYLKVFKNLPNFKFKSKLTTWIGQITYNTCLHYIQKKKLVLSVDTGKDGELPEDHIIDDRPNDSEKILLGKELRGILSIEIDRLSPLYKTLISLYHQEELSYAEIANITSLPEGTVKNYLFRARKKLKENLLLIHKKEEL